MEARDTAPHPLPSYFSLLVHGAKMKFDTPTRQTSRHKLQAQKGGSHKQMTCCLIYTLICISNLVCSPLRVDNLLFSAPLLTFNSRAYRCVNV